MIGARDREINLRLFMTSHSGADFVDQGRHRHLPFKWLEVQARKGSAKGARDKSRENQEMKAL